jgi:hypothetical protein
MLLSHCPNCQHDNKLGERFCAACGVPLDLKPCPVCGKVDSVKAAVCSGCGAHFPPLSPGSQPEEAGAAPVEHEKPIPPVVAPPPSTIRAFPLITIALAAGGIPLLWLFRNTMPVPKAWQAPAPAAIEVPATTLPPARPDVAPAPAPAPALIPLPAKPPVPAAVEPPPAAAVPVQPEPAKAKPAAKTKPVAKAKSPAAAPAQPTKPAGASECTEALAAVGLCERKAARE